ncbi:MAG: RNA methyltransferase substrate-binding domain-containing protein [Bianqueaceae bacterium]
MENMNQTIVGRNAVMEVLRAGHQLDQIYVQRPPHTGSLNKILALAEREACGSGGWKDKLDQLAGGENHQGLWRWLWPHAYTDVSDILALAEKKGQPHFC